jgi:ACS family sodium-dependent inorganic phosphate cotransporter
MSAQYGYDETVQGMVLASFFLGYASTQIVGGCAAQRFGSKIVLGWAVAGYSLFTLLTPAAAGVSLYALCLCRVLLGLAEGVSLPCIHQLTASWIPASERSRFLTACTSGQFCGTLAAMACAPLVEDNWGSIFYLFGSLGLVWAVLWYRFGWSTPRDHPTISPVELHYLESVVPERRAETMPWRRFVHSAFLADIVAHGSHNWGWYLLLSWLPRYLTSEYNVDLQTSGLLLLPVYAVPFVASNLSGLRIEC